jgi:hypothetical protein
MTTVTTAFMATAPAAIVSASVAVATAIPMAAIATMRPTRAGAGDRQCHDRDGREQLRLDTHDDYAR